MGRPPSRPPSPNGRPRDLAGSGQGAEHRCTDLDGERGTSNAGSFFIPVPTVSQSVVSLLALSREEQAGGTEGVGTGLELHWVQGTEEGTLKLGLGRGREGMRGSAKSGCKCRTGRGWKARGWCLKSWLWRWLECWPVHRGVEGLIPSPTCRCPAPVGAHAEGGN